MARMASTATPAALSVEYWGGQKTASGIRSRSRVLEETPPASTISSPGYRALAWRVAAATAAITLFRAKAAVSAGLWVR